MSVAETGFSEFEMPSRHVTPKARNLFERHDRVHDVPLTRPTGSQSAIGNAEAGFESVAICVCTYKRPAMLRRTLSAIASLEKPAAIGVWPPTVIVVDNECSIETRCIVKATGAVYVAEPKRGISHARNASLDAALAYNPELIAFIDDDAWPEPMWLAHMTAALAASGSDVVRGARTDVFPQPLPFWAVEKKKRRIPDAVWLPLGAEYVPAGNVVFKATLVRSGFLRFDPRFALTGGEDVDFFHRSHRMGAKIVAAPKAMMYEEVVPERCSYLTQIKRYYQYATGHTMVARDSGRFLSVVIKAALHVLKGARHLVLAGLSVCFGPRRFKKHALASGGAFCYAAGCIATLCGLKWEAYRNTQGY